MTRKLALAAALTLAAASLCGCYGKGTIQKEPLRPIIERVCTLADSGLVYLKRPLSKTEREGLETDILIIREAFEPTPED